MIILTGKSRDNFWRLILAAVLPLAETNAAGASRIYVIEISQPRGERLKTMGASEVINPRQTNAVERIKELTDGLGVDIAFDCVGNAVSGPFAVELARNLGTVVIVGMSPKPSPNFNFLNIMFTEKVILGSNGYTRDTATAIELMVSGRINPGLLITAKVPLKDAVEKGFKELTNNPDAHLKILLAP